MYEYAIEDLKEMKIIKENLLEGLKSLADNKKKEHIEKEIKLIDYILNKNEKIIKNKNLVNHLIKNFKSR